MFRAIKNNYGFKFFIIMSNQEKKIESVCRKVAVPFAIGIASIVPEYEYLDRIYRHKGAEQDKNV